MGRADSDHSVRRWSAKILHWTVYGCDWWVPCEEILWDYVTILFIIQLSPTRFSHSDASCLTQQLPWWVQGVIFTLCHSFSIWELASTLRRSILIFLLAEWVHACIWTHKIGTTLLPGVQMARVLGLDSVLIALLIISFNTLRKWCNVICLILKMRRLRC